MPVKLKFKNYLRFYSDKAITITAESVTIDVDGQLPRISDLKYTVDGLIENEKLLCNPSLKYSVKNISTDKEGKYEIIPYGADEGNNYRIKYVTGILLVGDYGEIPAGTELNVRIDAKSGDNYTGTLAGRYRIA